MRHLDRNKQLQTSLERQGDETCLLGVGWGVFVALVLFRWMDDTGSDV